MESMPSAGYVGDAYPYMQKHDPFVYYDDIRGVRAQLANVVPSSQLVTDLAAAAADEWTEGGRVATLVVADGVPAGFRSAAPMTTTACSGRSKWPGTWPP